MAKVFRLYKGNNNIQDWGQSVPYGDHAIAQIEDPNAADVEEGPVTGPTLKAPMGGTIIELHVKAGDKVKKGQSLLMYEAMKMQNEIEADGDYTVKRILVKEGEVIAAGQPIVEFVG